MYVSKPLKSPHPQEHFGSAHSTTSPGHIQAPTHTYSNRCGHAVRTAESGQVRGARPAQGSVGMRRTQERTGRARAAPVPASELDEEVGAARPMAVGAATGKTGARGGVAS